MKNGENVYWSFTARVGGVKNKNEEMLYY